MQTERIFSRIKQKMCYSLSNITPSNKKKSALFFSAVDMNTVRQIRKC